MFCGENDTLARRGDRLCCRGYRIRVLEWTVATVSERRTELFWGCFLEHGAYL
jgi:hypothetical protein